jgi:uncharacterized protein YbjT (DUF2867 family)
MKALIIGGTGLIGKRLVKLLGDGGHEAVAASPSRGINSVTGAGLAEAMKGASVVVDVTNAPSWEDTAVMAFFTTSTRNLLAASAAAGVRHFIALSVVGAERMPDNGFMRAKIAQEKLIEAGKTPYTIVRATQFFEFIGAIAESGVVDGTVRLPPAKFQPMAADDVAALLAEIVAEKPVNGMIELGGPEKRPMADFVRELFAKTGHRRSIQTDEKAMYFGAKIDDRTLTPGENPRLGPCRFDGWLRDFKAQAPARS